MIFSESIKMRVLGDNERKYFITLVNGTEIAIKGNDIVFQEDFFEFDRVKTNVKLPRIPNSGTAPRPVMIPYSSVLFFTESSE